MKTYKATLITPQGSLFDGSVTSVVAPGEEGRFEVLANHEHIIAILKKGVLKINSQSGLIFYSIDSGILEVDGNHNVIVLADKAIKAESQELAEQKISELNAA